MLANVLRKETDCVAGSSKNVDYDGKFLLSFMPAVDTFGLEMVEDAFALISIHQILVKKVTPHLSVSQVIFSAAVESLGFGVRFYKSAQLLFALEHQLCFQVEFE